MINYPTNKRNAVMLPVKADFEAHVVSGHWSELQSCLIELRRRNFPRPLQRVKQNERLSAIRTSSRFQYLTRKAYFDSFSTCSIGWGSCAAFLRLIVSSDLQQNWARWAKELIVDLNVADAKIQILSSAESEEKDLFTITKKSKYDIQLFILRSPG